MEGIASKLPKGIGFDWTGISYQERMAKSQGPILYTFSIIVIFLCLAALYESWTVPISVMLMLPLGVIGGVVASSLRGFPNDVYFQIGLLTVLGLTAKNAILIVQFAKNENGRGGRVDSGHFGRSEIEISSDHNDIPCFRFRGSTLTLANGAGAGAQTAIGTGVLGGMLAATFLATPFIPLFYVLICRMSERTKRGRTEAAESAG